MTVLFFDTETYSETPLKNGVHAYVNDPAAEVMIASWAVDDGDVIVEDLTEQGEPSEELLGLLHDESIEVVIQNSYFDRTVINRLWAKYGVSLRAERVHDTMVRAMTHGLPGGLEKLGEIFGLSADEAKDKDGKRLIQLFCVPRPKNMKVRRATRETHPDDWKRFLSYAGTDILAMRELYRKLPKWNYAGTERELWLIDQRINDRGFCADVALATSAIDLARHEQRQLRARAQELTYDEISSTTQRGEFLNYLLAEYGVDLPDLKKSTLERRLTDEGLPWAVVELIKTRLAQTTTSTSKYSAVLRAVSPDGRLRGSLQFCGALRTVRWAGRLFQPQNLPRPDAEADEIEAEIEDVTAGIGDLVLTDVMRSLRNALRGVIIAGPGRTLHASDLSNIEGRIAAWLSGEQWKLDAFADYDAGTGPDLYVLAYSRAFGVPVEAVTKALRQIGKVMELALGYEGGVGAFLAFAAVYNIDLEAMADSAYETLPEKAKTQAEIILQWRKKKRLTTYGLSDKAFVVCEAFKALWREAHPLMSKYWGRLEAAAMRAVRTPGVTVDCGRLRFRRKGAWLRMILPSGRSICYPSPKIEANARGEKLTYAGVNQYNRQWGRISTYGGKLFENACQAVARDVIAYSMPAIEAEGFEIVLSVHDEIIAEALDNSGLTSDHLSALMATNPDWLDGCPLSASGFSGKRYRKE